MAVPAGGLDLNLLENTFASHSARSRLAEEPSP
jgi:hypothetical protein